MRLRAGRELSKDLGAGLFTEMIDKVVESPASSGNRRPTHEGGRQFFHVISPGARLWVSRRWSALALAVIVLTSVGLSTYRVFKVPILQCPDEDSHIDYAFTIYSAGGLLNARTPPLSGWNTHYKAVDYDWERISHIYTLYLTDATRMHPVRLREDTKVSPDYGTLSYFQNVNRNAPKSPVSTEGLRVEDNPWLMTGYPFGYYALLALWLRLVSLFSHGLVELFFAARMLSVLLMVISLLLSYAILRELRLRKWRALALTAVLAWFPLTSYTAACVQPDNLSLTLTLASFYVALVLRRGAGGSRRPLLVLGAVLGALFVTKYHFYFIALLAVLLLLVTEWVFRRETLTVMGRRLGLLLFPSLIFGLVQLWVVWGAPLANNFHHAPGGTLDGIRAAVLDYYAGGGAYISYWSSSYGWKELPRLIKAPLQVLTLAVIALTCFRLEQVLTRLFYVGRRRWRSALRLAFSNPLVTGYFPFVAFMILLFGISGNSFYAQGRHFFPYILSGFLISSMYAPRALTDRRVQAIASVLITAGLLFYCAVGSYYAVRAVGNRYYYAGK